MKVFILFSSCYLLFTLHFWNRNHTFVQFYQPQTRPIFMLDLAAKTKPYFEKELLWAFSDALVTGNTKNLPKKEKNKFKELNLNHLFSPSGLHFTSLLSPIKPLIKFFPALGIIPFLFLPLFFVPGLFSLKRSLAFINLSFINRNTLKLSNSKIFIGVFILDFMIGAFSGSLLSLIFSLLFWGIFVLEHKLIKRLVFLFLAQYLCLCFFPANFYPLAVPANLFISLLFTLLFPLVLANFIFPTQSWIFVLNEKILDILYQIVTKLHHQISATPILMPSHILLWGLILYVFFPRKRLHLVLLTTLFFSMPTDSKDDLREIFELKLLKTSSWKNGTENFYVSAPQK